MFPRRYFACLCFLLGIGFAASASAQFEPLVRRVPATANTLVLVNTEKTLNSPVAVRDGWRKRLSEAHAAGLTIIPPDSKAAVFASHLDFDMMVPKWECAVMELDEEPNLKAFITRTGAIADKLGNYVAAKLTSDAYVVQFAPKIVAAMAPGDRQEVGRWVRETDARETDALPPYLKEAFGYANDLGTPIIMAIELQDVVTPAHVAAALAENPGFKDVSPADQARLAEALASVRGLTLGVTLGETSFGKVKVDFDKPIAITPDEAKAILLRAVKKHGVMIDELEEWTPKVNGKQATFEGTMTRSGLRRLFSIFSSPPAIKEPPKLEETASASPGSQQPNYKGPAYTSQQYYKQVDGFITDLRRKKANAQTMGDSAAYYETYARKIDGLSTLNVDEELVKFGSYASDSLRQACGALRGAAAQTRVREVNVQPVYDTYTYGGTYGYTYRSGYGGSGYVPYGWTATQNVYDAQATQRERTKIRSEERVGGYKSANEIMQNLEIASSDVKKKMTAKYSVDFQTN